MGGANGDSRKFGVRDLVRGAPKCDNGHKCKSRRCNEFGAGRRKGKNACSPAMLVGLVAIFRGMADDKDLR
jgi:hypothetical protein